MKLGAILKGQVGELYKVAEKNEKAIRAKQRREYFAQKNKKAKKP